MPWGHGLQGIIKPQMPIYEFECKQCGSRFEELLSADPGSPPCPGCGSRRTRRLLSTVSPSGRQPRGARVKASESRRGEREAARAERLAETKRKRAAGEAPPPRRGGGTR
jgi:putative FmdB family regulatory protein